MHPMHRVPPADAYCVLRLAQQNKAQSSREMGAVAFAVAWRRTSAPLVQIIGAGALKAL